MQVFAVLEDSSDINELTLNTPVPKGSEVLLKVIRSGVCHTDTHLREGSYDLGSRGKMRLADRGGKYPLVMGHEVVGIVEQVGAAVTDTKVGDTRLIFPWIGCGECGACRQSRDNLCAKGRSLGVAEHGGYATHILVPHDKYLIDIEGLDPSWAATFACSGLTAFSAVNKVLPLDPEDPVVVIGAGGVGLTAVSMLHALGHRATCVVDISAGNLKVAREMGASSTVMPNAEKTGAAILEACGGPVAAVIDFVNNGQTVTAAFDSLTKGGRLVHVGLFGGEFVMPTALMAIRMLTLQGSYAGNVTELASVVELAKQGKLPQIPITRADLSAASVSNSLDRLVQGGVSGRIVMSTDE